MDGPSQLGLPLQVQNAPMAHAHGAGDLMGQPELVIAEAGHGQAVGPAYGDPLRGDLDDLAIIIREKLFLEKVGAVIPLLNGFSQGSGIHAVKSLGPGQGGRLHHAFAKQGKPQRELGLVLAEPAGEVHERGEGLAGERRELGGSDDGAQAPEVGANGVIVAVGRFLKLRLDLEMLAESLVIVQEYLVNFLVADQDDLDREGQRLRLDGLGAGLLGIDGVLDACKPGTKRPEQSFPTEGVGQQIVYTKDQIPLVRPVQITRPNEVVPRMQSAEFGLPVQTSQQIEVGRVVADDHGRALGFAVVDDEIGMETVEDVVLGPVLGRQGEAEGLAGRRRRQLVKVFQNLLPDLGKEGLQLDLALMFLGQGREVLVQNDFHRLLVEVQLSLLVASVLLADAAHERADFVEQFIAAVLELALGFRLELFEFVVVQGLALHDGGE